MARNVSTNPTVIGTVPSFAMPHGAVQGPGLQSLPPAVKGSGQGVPYPDAFPGTGADQTQKAIQYGLSKAGAPPSHQPLFWLFVVFVLGVLMVAHFAHFNLRAAG